MDLVQFFGMLRRRWLPILLCLLAGGTGGYYLGHHQAKVYAAHSRAFVSVSSTHSINAAIQGTVLTNNQIQTFASIASSRAVAQRVVTELHLTESPTTLAKQLGAVVEKNTSIIDINASASTPFAAQELANSAAVALGDEIEALEVGQPNKVTARILDLATTPTSPIAPRPTLDLTIGILLGLLAGLSAAALLDALDRTIKSTAQADALFGAPNLGIVPRRRGPALVVGRDRTGPEGEPYRTLRTAVRFVRPDSPIRSLLVTSATPDEGKTTTAANLAVAIALSGERVIVVDADLRRAALAETFGVERSVGLTSLVLGTVTLDDALQTWDRGLDILASGPLPPNPSEIVGSQLFNRILRDLEDRADIVILDAPPALPVTDAVALAAQVDGVLLVARHGVTARTAAAEARQKFEGIGANIVGYVFNAVPGRDARASYSEYYYKPRRSGRAGQPPIPPPTATSVDALRERSTTVLP